MHIEQGLCFDDRNLIRICVERVNVQLITAGFEVDIAERLEAGNSLFRKLHKHTAIACELFKVAVTLTIKIWTHFLDLEISHIAHTFGERTFVISLACKTETFNQPPTRQQLSRCADKFGKTKFVREYTNNMRTACGPYQCFIFIRFNRSLFKNIEKLRMKRPLIKREGQFADYYICIWCIHLLKPIQNDISSCSYAVILAKSTV